MHCDHLHSEGNRKLFNRNPHTEKKKEEGMYYTRPPLFYSVFRSEMFRNAFNCLSGTILCYGRHFLLFIIESFDSCKTGKTVYGFYDAVVFVISPCQSSNHIF